MKQELVKRSRFLSLVLRHNPSAAGIELDENGWVEVAVLLDGCASRGKRMSRVALEEIVATNNKKRFAFSDDGLKIRASQGHSVDVDLGMKPIEPPEFLYHGTATRFIESIREKGLVRGTRQHVHLSQERDTAINVGSRHGKPVILTALARQMHIDGIEFFCSANGVWLTDAVSIEYLQFTDE